MDPATWGGRAGRAVAVGARGAGGAELCRDTRHRHVLGLGHRRLQAGGPKRSSTPATGRGTGEGPCGQPGWAVRSASCPQPRLRPPSRGRRFVPGAGSVPGDATPPVTISTNPVTNRPGPGRVR